jgi:ribonuclease-3
MVARGAGGASGDAVTRAHNTITRLDVEHLTGHRVHDLSHYRQAFVHKSMHRVVGVSCERLELLGDAVINLAVADMLLEAYPSSTEGFITRVRVKIVSGKQLARFAKSLELHRWLVLSTNARTMNVAQNDRILEDVFEAFVGALYSDMGFEACRAFMMHVIHEHIDLDALVTEDNYKDLLSRYAQHQAGSIHVEYETERVEGPAHKRLFTSVVKLNGVRRGSGSASSKKTSEMLAARDALAFLNVDTTAAISGAVSSTGG